MVVIINVPMPIPLARGISRVMNLENVKNASEISKQNIKKLFLPGEYWGLRKRRIWK
jgi:hypothetical protein